METEGREEYGGKSLRSWRPDGRNWRWSHPGFSAAAKGAGSQVAGGDPEGCHGWARWSGRLRKPGMPGRGLRTAHPRVLRSLLPLPLRRPRPE